MSATSIDLFLFASTLASASPVGSFGVRAAHSARRVPVGTWVMPGSNEKRDDVLVTLAKRAVVLLGESHDQARTPSLAASYNHGAVQPQTRHGPRFRDVPAARSACARSLVQGRTGRIHLPARGRLAADLGLSPPSSTCRYSISPACTACQCWRSISIGRPTVGLRHKD